VVPRPCDEISLQRGGRPQLHPSWFNNEGNIDGALPLLADVFGGPSFEYFGLLREWGTTPAIAASVETDPASAESA
jgi:hypothetical protein